MDSLARSRDDLRFPLIPTLRIRSWKTSTKTDQRLFEQAADTLERYRDALDGISNGNAALEDGSEFARGWNAGRFRMREIARTALSISVP